MPGTSSADTRPRTAGHTQMPTYTPSLLDILAHTPVWVWVLYVFVIFMGLSL